MKKIDLTSITRLFMVCTIFCISMLTYGQEKIGWLEAYTDEIIAGSDTYKYGFYAVDANDCKLKIEEDKTDKKGRTTTTSWVFYLSDLNPAALSFKPSKKIIRIDMETKQSQKFISVYEDGEFAGYTSSVSLNTDEVDKARSFIDNFKTRGEDCEGSDMTWSSPSEAFSWLMDNIGESNNSGTVYKQTIKKGAKEHLAELETTITDSKGNQEEMLYIFNMSDIIPSGVMLNVSRNSLSVELPVREKNNYIQIRNMQDEISYSSELEIYFDDIEVARNAVHAFTLLANEIKPVRAKWNNYSEAMTFVKNNLKEARSGSDNHAQTLSFDPSASGIVDFVTVVTDSKGASEKTTSYFYMNDIQPGINLKVSSRDALLELETRDRNKYIKQTKDGILQSYTNSFNIYVDDIDAARDMQLALDYAINTSEAGIEEFSSTGHVQEWLKHHPGEVLLDGESIKQNIAMVRERENKIEVQTEIAGDDGTAVYKYEIYPEDLSLDDLAIEVSGDELTVPLSTGRVQYIKAYEGNELQNFDDEIEIFFNDVQVAKNFISALRFVRESSQVKSRLMKDNETALNFLTESMNEIQIDGVKYEQQLETMEADNCKLRFIRNLTDEDGTKEEFIFEFMASDIDPINSEISVSNKEIDIELITNGREKLIKPYENGDTQNFDYHFSVITNDILHAKKILAAFQTLAEGCK